MAQLWIAKLQRAQRRVEQPVSSAVAVGGALVGLLVPSGTDQTIYVRRRQPGHDSLRNTARKVIAAGFGHQLG